MGKVEANKMEKSNALLSTAFRLFTNKGFSKTTISDIANEAGIAKGTFYLYFKDKYDIRDRLIASKARQLFTDAADSLKGCEYKNLDDLMLAFVDYIIGRFKADPSLLSFIAKNLSWGIFRNALDRAIPMETAKFYQFLDDLMKRDSLTCSRPDLMLFTITELVGSASYSCILYNQPVPIDDYLPYLHQSIRAIIHSFAVPSGETGQPEEDASGYENTDGESETDAHGSAEAAGGSEKSADRSEKAPGRSEEAAGGSRAGAGPQTADS